jgi:predicted RNase H-like nuclease (RuvC/YqgF family)
VVFVGFKEAIRKLSSSDLTSFHKTYELKASIVGKVTTERLLEKEELVGKLNDESRQLKRDLNKSQASGLNLEKQIVELTKSLKKCQDEKLLVETTLRDSKKDLEKLNKAREDDLTMSENLRKKSKLNMHLKHEALIA